MKNFIKKIIVFYMLCSLITSSNVLFASEIAITDTLFNDLGYYEYPLTPKDSEWLNLTIEERVEICRIPQKILKIMSDEQLIQAIITYPFVCDAFLYSTPEYGVKVVEKTCDAYAELLNRDTGKQSLVNFLEQRKNVELLSVGERVDNEYIIRLLLYQEKFKNNLTTKEIELFSNMSFREKKKYNLLSNTNSSFIKTPKGTDILYELRYCDPAEKAEHEEEDERLAASYGVTVVSSGNCACNCHSYAWYSQNLSTNRYWINNPAPYMTDDSYVQALSSGTLSSLSVGAGCIVFYGTISNDTVSTNSHSAIIYDEPSGVSLENRIVISKWGEYGVFRHKVTVIPRDSNDNPEYDIANLSAWSR